MSSSSPYSLVVSVLQDTYMLLPSKIEREGDQPARTLPVYLVWGTGGVTLGCDESGLFEPCIIGEGNVGRPLGGGGREPEDE